MDWSPQLALASVSTALAFGAAACEVDGDVDSPGLEDGTLDDGGLDDTGIGDG